MRYLLLLGSISWLCAVPALCARQGSEAPSAPEAAPQAPAAPTAPPGVTFLKEPAKTDMSIALDINGKGMIAGYYRDKDGHGHLLRWASRTAAPVVLRAPGGGGDHNAEALLGINSQGHVAGVDDVNRESHAVLWKSPDQPLDLGIAGGASTDINDADQVVGVGDFPLPAWEWRDENHSNKPDPGEAKRLDVRADRVFVRAINSQGTVVGRARVFGDITRGVVWDQGSGSVGRFIEPTVGVSTEAIGIDDQGRVLARDILTSGAARFFLWKDGQVLRGLDPPGDDFTEEAWITPKGAVWLADESGRLYLDSGDGQLQTMSKKPSGSTFYAFNDAGDGVGVINVGGPDRAFVFHPTPMVIVQGQVQYEKPPVTDAGLDLSQLPPVGAFGVTVELVKKQGNQVLASSDPVDADGFFSIEAPAGAAGPAYLRARAESEHASVLDARKGPGSIFELKSATFTLPKSGSVTQKLLATDHSRLNGPFNIVVAIETAAAAADLIGLDPPLANVSWSPTATDRSLDPVIDLIRLRGNRAVDSDDMDDDVIMALYARFLLGKVSRDDNPFPGSTADPDELVDPRMAWSEGWGIYFACLSKFLAFNTEQAQVFRDSRRSGVLRLDLEANRRGDLESREVVASVLWDSTDANDDGETVKLTTGQLVDLLNRLKSDFYVDLNDFLAEMRAVASDGDVNVLVELHGIDSTAPFPQPIQPGDDPTVLTGVAFTQTHSFSALARDHYTFEVAQQNTRVNLHLEITSGMQGVQSADLDLRLLDQPGNEIKSSAHKNGVGGTEDIHVTLAPGRYVIVVDSVHELKGKVIPTGASFKLTAIDATGP